MRAGQREAERRAHERRRAGRRDDDGEHAGAERVERPVLRTSSSATPDGASWPNSNTPDRFSASTKNRIASARDDRRRLQLEAPAQLLAGGAQRGEQQPQRDERQHDAGRERDGLAPQRRPRVVVRREAQHLERQHREHAGHQVEDAGRRRARTRARARASGRRADRRRRREIERRRRPRAPASRPRRRCRSSATSIVAARAPLPKPLAAVTTPAMRSEAARERGRDRQRQHVSAAVARDASAAPTARSGPVAYGKKRIAPGSAAPAGGVELQRDRRAAAFARSPAIPRAAAAARRAPRRSAAPQRGSGGAAFCDRAARASRSAPSGMQISLHTSQSARAASDRRVADSQRAPRLQLDEMQHLAFVAVVDERPDRQHARRRPFDRPGLDAGGQLPVERRRQPGIAGIPPVRVPALLDRQAQRDGQRLAGNERGLRGDELGLDVLGPHRRRDCAVAASASAAAATSMRQAATRGGQ